ncbi:MAG: hypothetical protein ABI451_05875 [Dokdonella sp.]
MNDKDKKKTGPEAATVKIDEPWEDAVRFALKKPKPEDGWPEEPKPKPNKDKPA